jgi:LEA14-like dessication related protein
VELNIAGDRLASGVSNRAFVVPAHGDTQFDMSVTANAALALLKLNQRRGAAPEAIDYDLSGAASVDLPFLRELPFKQHGSFDISR